MKKILNAIAAWIVTRIPIFIPSLTLGFGWGGKYVRRWYETNGIFKFKQNEEIELKSLAIIGYGLRPKGVVVGYEQDDAGEGYYIIDMTSDDTGNWHKLINEGWVPANVTRSTKRQSHFKWNIENNFKLCRCAEAKKPLMITV